MASDTTSSNCPRTAAPWLPLLATALAITVGYVHRAWGSNVAQLIHFFPDDAFYYLQTACNFVTGHGMTFDGCNPTNGFHPLFFALASLLAWLFGKPGLLHAVFIVHGAMLCLAAVLAVRIGRRIPAWAGVPSVAMLGGYFLLAGVWFSAGMESALVVLTSVLVHRALTRCWDNGFVSTGEAASLGAAIAAFLLSRLDMVLVLVPAVVALGVRFCVALWRRRTRTAAGIALALAIPGVCGLLYVVANVVMFGDAVPVSARAKQLFWIPFEMSWNASTAAGRLPWVARALLPLVLALGVCGLSCLPRRWRALNPFSAATRLLAPGTILFYAYLRFFSSNFFSWYFSFPLAFAALAGIELLDAVFGAVGGIRGLRSPTAIALITCELLLIVTLHVHRLHRVATRTDSIQGRLREVTERMNREVPAPAVIATYDAGAIGFFSRHRVINLDGLANSHDYLHNYRARGRMVEYFEQQGVTHFLVRDSLIANWAEVASGTYARARFGPDPRLEFDASQEFIRVAIPEHFQLVGYRLRHPILGHR